MDKEKKTTGNPYESLMQLNIFCIAIFFIIWLPINYLNAEFLGVTLMPLHWNTASLVISTNFLTLNVFWAAVKEIRLEGWKHFVMIFLWFFCLVICFSYTIQDLLIL